MHTHNNAVHNYNNGYNNKALINYMHSYAAISADMYMYMWETHLRTLQ